MGEIIEITDFSAPALDMYARMSENQLAHAYEPDAGVFIAESPNVIMRALDAGYEPESILIEKKQIGGAGAEVIKVCGCACIYGGI